jgi:hypothetical protein
MDWHFHLSAALTEETLLSCCQLSSGFADVSHHQLAPHRWKQKTFVRLSFRELVNQPL